MERGLSQLLERIEGKPDERLINRFLALLADLPEEERARRALDLAATLVEKKSHEALRIAHMVYSADPLSVRSLEIVVAALRQLGRYGKATVLEREKEALQEIIADHNVPAEGELQVAFAQVGESQEDKVQFGKLVESVESIVRAEVSHETPSTVPDGDLQAENLFAPNIGVRRLSDESGHKAQSFVNSPEPSGIAQLKMPSRVSASDPPMRPQGDVPLDSEGPPVLSFDPESAESAARPPRADTIESRERLLRPSLAAAESDDECPGVDADADTDTDTDTEDSVAGRLIVDASNVSDPSAGTKSPIPPGDLKFCEAGPGIDAEKSNAKSSKKLVQERHERRPISETYESQGSSSQFESVPSSEIFHHSGASERFDAPTLAAAIPLARSSLAFLESYLDSLIEDGRGRRALFVSRQVLETNDELPWARVIGERLPRLLQSYGMRQTHWRLEEGVEALRHKLHAKPRPRLASIMAGSPKGQACPDTDSFAVKWRRSRKDSV